MSKPMFKTLLIVLAYKHRPVEKKNFILIPDNHYEHRKNCKITISNVSRNASLREVLCEMFGQVLFAYSTTARHGDEIKRSIIRSVCVQRPDYRCQVKWLSRSCPIGLEEKKNPILFKLLENRGITTLALIRIFTGVFRQHPAAMIFHCWMKASPSCRQSLTSNRLTFLLRDTCSNHCLLWGLNAPFTVKIY